MSILFTVVGFRESLELWLFHLHNRSSITT